MARITSKPISQYPWIVRLFLKRQQRKYGRVLAPSFLWGRLPGPFLGVLATVGFFGSKRFPIGTALRSLVSIRIAQLNGCFFCIDLNSFNFLRAAGQQEKATQIERWRESEIYSPAERAALEYAETMTTRCAEIGDAEIEELREFFSDDEVAGLTAWIAFQNMSAKFNAALGAEEHGFCRLPPRK